MKWKFAVDQGGTFTDIIGVDPDGSYHTLKLLSRSPEYGDPSIEGIRRILGTSPGEPLPEDKIEAIRFGTTVATNAFLERKGSRVALFITAGLGDILDIGYQTRPDLFSLCIRKPEPLYAAVFEMDERINGKGDVVTPLDEKNIITHIDRLGTMDIDAVAVVSMHAWKNPVHEILCGRLLEARGFNPVFLSHRTLSLIKIVTRGQSTVIDAYLSVPIALYTESIQRCTGNIRIEFMESSGRLTGAGRFRGKAALLSGPAGGVVAVAGIAGRRGIGEAIGFDMGGTSTDVSRFDGEFLLRPDQVLGGLEFRTEMLGINTVASGGGSILWFDGQKMRVGPESAGADPGPACYGFGGPLTITDANVMTGRVAGEFFPKTFGRDRKSPVDIAAVRQGFQKLTDRINTDLGRSDTPVGTALGFLQIADEKMAMAIREVSVSKGYDVTKHVLVCFGGAGGQHACGIASSLGIRRILIHPLGSLLSAYGMGLAKQAWTSSLSVLRPYTPQSHGDLARSFLALEETMVNDHGLSARRLLRKRMLDLRPLGTDMSLSVECRDYDQTAESFRQRYRRTFGFSPGDGVIEVENIRVELEAEEEFFPPYRHDRLHGGEGAGPVTWQTVAVPEGEVLAPVFLRETAPAGETINGPALIVDAHTTVVVDPGFTAVIDESAMITIDMVAQGTVTALREHAAPDPVLLEVFNNLYMNIASEMGHVLRNTSCSVNIKERLDFSCALFDGRGDLVANAPHIPVHLGSMADTVKAVLARYGSDMQPGDLFLTNNPYRGGSHLPDMTVVCPFFLDGEGPLAFTAARGHHADIGGIVPGSLLPEARHIDEEGVLIDPMRVARGGTFFAERLARLLTDSPYPARNISERLLDVQAQMAACLKGARDLAGAIAKYGTETVTHYMKHIQDNGAMMVRQGLARFLGPGNIFEGTFGDRLDDGSPIMVRIVISGGSDPPGTVQATIDFSGTGPQHDADSLNAPLPVTRSAVLYVLRTIAGTDIPLNSGCLRPVRIIAPEGTILNPRFPAPVSTGNVETSQRIVDVLLGALGLAAASQGTMNNLLFQVEGDTPYYETIAGGSGATEGCAGASGVQVHMTNTRMTDPEILEYRHPGVLLKRFMLRRGSGGRGLFPGGDGLAREIAFLKPARVVIISERRRTEPYGLEGGQPGARGMNLLRRADGRIVGLPHRVTLELEAGDAVVIETPGGGGWGKG